MPRSCTPMLSLTVSTRPRMLSRSWPQERRFLLCCDTRLVTVLGARAAEIPPLPSDAARVLTGRHWLAGDEAAGQLALLGFLPRSWAYVCDLYSRRSGRALQKAYELMCWWRLSDRVSRRRALALELKTELDEDTVAEADPDTHVIALLRSEHLGKASNAPSSVSCTRKATGLASDEIESGWSKHAHFSIPPVMRNSNVCAMLLEPLSQKELAQCDCDAPLKLDSTALVPAEMGLRRWLARVRNPRDPSYDVQFGGADPAARCQVHGCVRGACLIRLRVGSAVICADHLWECRVGVKAAALSAGFCACCLAPVEGVATWVLSYGHRVCAACAETEGRTLPTRQEDQSRRVSAARERCIVRTNSDSTDRSVAGPALRCSDWCCSGAPPRCSGVCCGHAALATRRR